jgi:hypothetical protein
MSYASVIQDVVGDDDRNNFYYHEIKDGNQSFEREEQALCFGFIIGRCWVDEHLSQRGSEIEDSARSLRGLVIAVYAATGLARQRHCRSLRSFEVRD